MDTPKAEIIRSREVVIDENLRCNPNDPNIEGLLQNSVPGKQAVLDIPDFRSRSIGLPYGIDETYRRKIPTQMDLKLKLKQLSWILPLRNR